jgi:hypothetical protein
MDLSTLRSEHVNNLRQKLAENPTWAPNVLRLYREDPDARMTLGEIKAHVAQRANESANGNGHAPQPPRGTVVDAVQDLVDSRALRQTDDGRFVLSKFLKDAIKSKMEPKKTR